ncbi:MAG: hypothetical protein HYT93_01345 [Parcubacteria group bacterium]|nr:hypothetical protein [Parcubacteria group bacterium]
MHTKQKIYFIPQYIGPLKHYERLIPHLKNTYDVGFLFISGDDSRRRELIEYCKHKHYTYYILEKGLKGSSKFHIPFFTPVKNRYAHSIECRTFLKTIKPAKIIAVKSRYPYDTIFKEANRMGIETITLQWGSALLTRQSFGVAAKEKTFARNIYYRLLGILFWILDLFYKEPRFGFTPAIPNKIGVFTKKEAQDSVEKGHDFRTVHVVGPLDFQITNELKQKIDSNHLFRTELLSKYGLSEDKIKIFVNLFRFHVLPIPEGYTMTPEEHVTHHSSLFKMIQTVFPTETADIILKIHPSEVKTKTIYESYKKFDIKIYHNESRTDELLCLSDIYIGDPTSSVNYMVLASGVPALFTNFSNFRKLNDNAKHFYIKHVVANENEFIETLRQFKSGILPKQYDNAGINLKSVDKTIEFINK